MALPIMADGNKPLNCSIERGQVPYYIYMKLKALKATYSLLILFFIAIFLAFAICTVNGYFYPMKYKEKIKEVSAKYDISAALISSVANVESSFRANRVSSKGAKGIMQLMPETAEWLCSKMGLLYEEDRLFDGEYSINLGGYYLSYLSSLFENEDCVICAYNAGQNKVKQWLSDSNYSTDGVTLTNIPYTETANYLKKVKINLSFYKNKYK